jgi:high-affinity nickel permease
VALGFTLGVRHAADADHLAAIGALLSGRGGVRSAAVTAALWGGGHSATFWGLGLLVVLLGVRLPEGFERGMELLIAALLIGLGLVQLARLGSKGRKAAEGAQGVRRWRPLLLGVAHGMAGSAGVALMALVTIPTKMGALLYLLLFGVGVVAGMVLITLVLGAALSWSVRHSGRLHLALMVAASAASVLVGLALALG